MKNFSGRILILIAVILGVCSLFADLGITIFYIWTKFEIVIAELSAPNAIFDYIGLVIHVFSILFFIITLILCIKNIILANSMKNNLYLSIISLSVVIFSYLFNILVPGIVLFDSVPFLTSLFAIKTVVNLMLMIGSFLNYRRDCRN